MRKMNPIVASGVIPAAMHVHCALAIGQGEMLVSAIHVAARALPFEIKENVRQRRPFQEVVLYLEAARTGCTAAGHDLQHIVARGAECGKIRLPIRPVAPVIHMSG